MSSLLLLLADGRFPGGGYTHSGGLEAAVAEGVVFDQATLHAFAEGKLTTAALLDAWFAAEACRIGRSADQFPTLGTGPSGITGTHRSTLPVGITGEEADRTLVDLARLHAEYEARVVAAPLRAASQQLARGLRRVTASLWLLPPRQGDEYYPVLLGSVANAAGLDHTEAAQLAVHGVLMGVLTAAPKLFAIDMTDAMAIAAALAPLADDIADEAASMPLPPAVGAPAVDLRAERHASWEVRLFAS
jgi:urease accessory protein